MCKEGVKIGRRTAYRSHLAAVVPPAISPLIGANPSRVGLILSADTLVLINAGTGIDFYADPSTNGGPFAGLNQYVATRLFRVEEWGQLVTGAVWCDSASVGPMNVYVTELYLTQILESI